MKKLLSIFAAAALVFGFASCSGDLHDSEPLKATDYFLRGNMNDWGSTALTDNGDNWTVKFNAANTETQFAIATPDASWTIAYRMDAEGSSTCVDFTADDVSKKTEKNLYAGSGMSNATIATVVGAEYTVTIKPQAGYLTVSVEQGELPKDCYIISDNVATKLNLDSPKKYSTTFTPTATSYKFSIFDGTDTWGTDTPSTSSDMTLVEDKTITVTGLTAGLEYLVTLDISGAAPVCNVAINNDFVGFTGIAAEFTAHAWTGGTTEVPLIFGTNKHVATYTFEAAVETYFIGVKKGASWDVRYEAAEDGEPGDEISTSTTELSNDTRGLVTVEVGEIYTVTVTKDGDDVTLVVTKN